MRVNIYAEEMTQRVEIVEKNGFTGLRLYLELPVTVPGCVSPGEAYAAGYGDGGAKYPSQESAHREGKQQVSGPFLHHEGDDDSSAVTFWGKRDMREVITIMRLKLDEHYGKDPTDMFEQQARAWMSCCAQLDRGSPRWSGRGTSGCDSAMREIQRLQEIEREQKQLETQVDRLTKENYKLRQAAGGT